MEVSITKNTFKFFNVLQNTIQQVFFLYVKGFFQHNEMTSNS